jgi:hypothetical protein
MMISATFRFVLVIRIDRFSGFHTTMHRSTEKVAIIRVELWTQMNQMYLKSWKI